MTALSSVENDDDAKIETANSDNADEFISIHNITAEDLLAQTLAVKNTESDADLPLSAQIDADLKAWGYDFWFDDLDDSPMLGDRRMDDTLLAELHMKARDKGYGSKAKPSLSALDDEYVALAARNRRHVVREYLDNLTWDGKDQIALLAVHVAGDAPDVAYSDGTTHTLFHVTLRRWLYGAVARARGDEDAMRGNAMLVLASKEQGLGKSQLAAFLCPLDGLFVDKGISPDNKDASLARARTLVWEVGELGATTGRAHIEALKAFITATTVTERKPYGHYEVHKKPLASYIGTVNLDGAGFLHDGTGNRRFWVVPIRGIDWEYDKVVSVDQLWAQANAAYEADKNCWHLTPQENAALTATAAEAMAADPTMEYVARVVTACTEAQMESGAQESEWTCTGAEILDALLIRTHYKQGSANVDGRNIGKAVREMWPWVNNKRRSAGTVYYGLRLRHAEPASEQQR